MGQGGSERNDGHTYFTPDELLRMVWLCENVDGAIPVYEELSAKAQRIVRLQGIYRDAIPPEKRGGTAMKLLLLSDRESPYLWDYYQTSRNEFHCGLIFNISFLTFL